jgi:site-specific recombinase
MFRRLGERLRYLRDVLRGEDAAREEFTAVLGAFLDAATHAERSVAIERLFTWQRADLWSGAADNARPRLALLSSTLDDFPDLRAQFHDAIAAFIGESDAVGLFAESGIPSDRGMFAEAADRLLRKLLPRPRDEHSMSRLVPRLFRTAAQAAFMQSTSTALFERIRALMAPPDRPAIWEPMRAQFTDAFRLLGVRVEGQGLSSKLRARGSGGAHEESPFRRLRAAADALARGWLEGDDLENAAAAWRHARDAVRAELRVVHGHLEAAGVSVDIVFGLEVIERALLRMDLMLGVMEARDERGMSARIQALLVQLVRRTFEDRSVRHLLRWNLHLLDRKIVERAGETGEHYIARDRREYRHIWVAAAGGGLLTTFTAALKLKIHSLGLPLIPEGFLAGLNYAVSFLIMHRWGLILATKQPAMTAATLAAIIRDHRGDDRSERIVHVTRQLTSSQLASAIANVTAVSLGAGVLGFLWSLLFGQFLPSVEAVHTAHLFNPVASGTVLYAAETGVVLWLASLVGGWFDNFSVYHRVPQGIAEHPLGRVIGVARMARIAISVRRNAAGWATSIALGFGLGFTPAFGKALGLPLDVRHVTLSTGQMAIATVADAQHVLPLLISGAAGIASMFVLNLSVSFSLALWNAAHAYGMSARELRGLYGMLLRQALRRPHHFIFPPRDNAPRDTAGGVGH